MRIKKKFQQKSVRREKTKKIVAATKKSVNVDDSRLEEELAQVGSIKDKINALTLMITKNPAKTRKQLIDLIELASSTRAETAFYILNNLKSLLINDLYKCLEIKEKQKIVSLFKNYLNNMHIKHKVVSLVYDLLRKNILFDDLIYVFVNKLGDNSEAQKKVEKYLKLLYTNEKNRESINKVFEDMFESDLNLRNKIVNFLNNIRFTGVTSVKIYKKFYETLSERNFRDVSLYEKTLDNVVQGLIIGENNQDLKGLDIKRICKIYKNNNLNLGICRLLLITNNRDFYSYTKSLIASLSMVESSKLPYLMITLRGWISKKSDEAQDVDLLITLLKVGIFYDNRYIVSVIMMVSEYLANNKVENGEIYALLGLYCKHYHCIVAKFAEDVLNGSRFIAFNPFSEDEFVKREMFYYK